MSKSKFLIIALLPVFLSGCGGGSDKQETQSVESVSSQTEAAPPNAPLQTIDVAGTTTLDVSTWQSFIAALAPAFISGDDKAIAAVAYPNEEMMKAHILRHYGAADAKAEIDLMDVKMPMDLAKVLASIQTARGAAIEAGADFSEAVFDSSERISGLSIGGMKVNTLGMNLKSGEKIYSFELKECRDILGRWVTMGEARFAGVKGGAAEVQEDGTLDLGL